MVAAYETALGLTRSGLVAFCISARKLARPDASAIAAVETHRVSADRFEQVLEEVVDGEPTGADWLDFGSYVATHTDHVILPTSLWRTVATRLLRELGLSVGPAYATRSEAALLLARHARARPALTHSIGQYVTTPDSLLVADPIALLQSMDTPQAGDLTLLLLEQPPGQIRYGAAWVAAAKVRRKQFDEAQMHRLEAIVVRMVREDGLADGGLFNRVADLVAVLPDDTQDRIRQATHTAARVDPLMAAASDVATKTWPRSLVVKVCSGVARPSGEPDDPLLERLVEEALFHRIAERRFHASLSLALSPYGPRIAAGCARLVARALDGEPVDPQLVEKTLVLLTFIGTEAERDLLCRVAEGDADTLRTAAYVSVAHLPPAPGESRRPAVVPLLRVASPANEAVVRAALLRGDDRGPGPAPGARRRGHAGVGTPRGELVAAGGARLPRAHPPRHRLTVLGGPGRGQCFLPCGMISILLCASAFACFSARFSLRDLPAFLDMCCLGDLSAMAAPWSGSLGGSALSTVRLPRPAVAGFPGPRARGHRLPETCPWCRCSRAQRHCPRGRPRVASEGEGSSHVERRSCTRHRAARHGDQAAEEAPRLPRPPPGLRPGERLPGGDLGGRARTASSGRSSPSSAGGSAW